MKGLHHNVIEINDTENDNIDRILVFLKPDTKDVALCATRAQAAQILKELDVKKVDSKKPWIKIAAASAALLAAAALLAVLFL